MKGVFRNLDAQGKWYELDKRLELGIMTLKGMEMESIFSTWKYNMSSILILLLLLFYAWYNSEYYLQSIIALK